MYILVLNAGSSSHKSCLYNLNPPLPDTPPQPLWSAQLDWTKQPGQVELTVKTADGRSLQQTLDTADRQEGLTHLLNSLWSGETAVVADKGAIAIVGHRIVHGGATYQQSVPITPAVKAEIQALSPLAPAHNPANLGGIEAIEQILGDVPQVAVFDTAFHSQMPAAAFTYPLPKPLQEQGIRRYGFHGISHRYCAEQAAQLLGKDLKTLRLVTCHLGNGCSLAAVKDGRSIDTTMGFTPLDGLMMGSRSGAIDPGILIHLLRSGDYDLDQLDDLLNQESGLKGVSGTTSDMRGILAGIENRDRNAMLAFDIYSQSLCRGIGAMIGSLGGVDALVFTAGVGEHTQALWHRVAHRFEFLGLTLAEDTLTTPGDRLISTPEAKVAMLIIHTQEEYAIARTAAQIAIAAPP
jgi:acetate kinase